jgi:hypothetical protein
MIIAVLEFHPMLFNAKLFLGSIAKALSRSLIDCALNTKVEQGRACYVFRAFF